MGEYFKMDNGVKSEQSILSETIKCKNITCKRIMQNLTSLIPEKNYMQMLYSFYHIRKLQNYIDVPGKK